MANIVTEDEAMLRVPWYVGDRLLINNKHLKVVTGVSACEIRFRDPTLWELSLYRFDCLRSAVRRWLRRRIVLAVPTCTLWEPCDDIFGWEFVLHRKWTVSAYEHEAVVNRRDL